MSKGKPNNKMNTRKAESTMRSPRRTNKATRMSRRSTAGGALFLLLSSTSTSSSSSCAAFRGPHPPPSSAIRRHRGGGGELRYRDGDDDRTVDVRPADANDAWAVLQSASAPPPTTTLFPPRSSSSSPSPATGPAAVEADAMQVDMDEYIEYLERRYSRIHRVTTTTTVVFDHRIARSMFPSRMLDRRTSASASSASRCVVAPQGGGECDHLSVLGLSGLASAGLRRRLNGASSSPSSRKSRGLHRLLIDRTRSTAIALASSFRIATDFFIMTMAPDLLEGGTFVLPLASFAVLLLVRPLLRWRHFGQG